MILKQCKKAPVAAASRNGTFRIEEEIEEQNTNTRTIPLAVPLSRDRTRNRLTESWRGGSSAIFDFARGVTSALLKH